MILTNRGSSQKSKGRNSIKTNANVLFEMDSHMHNEVAKIYYEQNMIMQKKKVCSGV